MGNVAIGNYQLSTCSWMHIAERGSVLDYANIIDSKLAMFYQPSQPKGELDFFTRPLKAESWFFTILLSVISLSMMIGLTYFTGMNKDLFSAKITIYVFWMFFTLFHAYYVGALAMLFISEDKGKKEKKVRFYFQVLFYLPI